MLLRSIAVCAGLSLAPNGCAPPENSPAPPSGSGSSPTSTEPLAAPVYADAPDERARDEAPPTAADSASPAPASPEPESEPPPEPPTQAEIQTSLMALGDALRVQGLNRTPSNRLHGWLPKPATDLRAAWDEGRAVAWRGTPAQIRDWSNVALFGAKKPQSPTVSGLAAPFDVEVVRVDDQNAFLHVSIPAAGLTPAPGVHRSWVKDEPWVCIADHLEPGVDFIPFKSSEQPSAHRQWAREWVVDELVTIAQRYRDATGGLVGIGDASMVLGGKMSDHWTHRRGVDVDLYLLDHTGDAPRVWWHQWKRDASRWTSKAEGKGEVEAKRDDGSDDTGSDTRLRALAESTIDNDKIWFVVHDSPRVLAEFDARAQERRPGRRYLHADNRAFWPAHQDHVHVRWATARTLPVGVPPKP